MRTTLNIADDVLFAAKELACREKKSLGTVISALARRALTQPATSVIDGRTSTAALTASLRLASYGIHPLPRARRAGHQ